MKGRGYRDRARRTPVPDAFFSRDLPRLGDPAAVKVFLHVAWRSHRRRRGAPPGARVADLAADPTLVRSLKALGHAEAEVAAIVDKATEELVAGGLLLAAPVAAEDGPQGWVWVNDPEGRRARDRAASGLLRPAAQAPGPPPAVRAEGSSIFSLYEDNIGALTPLLAEELAEAQAEYPRAWIEEAFREAVGANVRKWSYARAILERWAREGKGDEAHRASGEGPRAKYLEGPYADYIQH
ncbi:MAG: DnaD domain protein [Anaerolineae bacterium]